MSKVVIDMSMSLDGFVAGPDDGRKHPRGKDIKLGGTSPGKQALAAGLCDEILIHIAPYLLGAGVRLFDALPDGIPLEKLSVSDGPFATHMRYRVLAKHA